MASSSTEQQQQASLNSLFPDTNTIDSICIGSGRFLRAVLVPALAAAGYHPAVVQTRSRGFLDHSLSEVASENGNSSWAFSYEVDTVNFDGSIETTNVPCWGAGTLGSPEGKKDVLELCASGLLLSDEKPLVLGLGVTEAGLSSSSTKVMGDLYDVLGSLATRKAPPKQISVINTDNVSQNGDVIRGFMEELATNDGSTRAAAMRQFLADSVVFHNTMVDRITSQRPGSDGLVPRAEPTPLKALVIEDLRLCLPQSFRETDGELFRRFGVVVRSSHKGQLDADIALKLRVANGTHTAIAHAMALSGLPKTDALVSGTAASKLLVGYLDSFFEHQIRAGVVATDDFDAAPGEAEAVYGDWRKRLTHAHFGLSTFFITQNGAAKGGIRIGPTVGDLLGHGLPVACSTAFALAAILRFLTPAHERGASSGSSGVYRGWLDGGGATPNEEQRAVAYADGLSYDLGEGWYEFRCDCGVELDGEPTPLPVALAAAVHSGGPRQPPSYEAVVGAYLRAPKGGNLSAVARSAPGSFSALAGAVAALYARMVAGDAAIDVLGGLDLEASCDCLVDGVGSHHRFDDSSPLHYKKASIPDDSRLMKTRIGRRDRETIPAVVFSEVSSVVAIDLHTHLLPPTHGPLCLWGIDELLTYHYLVAEYFVTAPPSITPESFYALSKQKQADLIWRALFIDRSPISEACRGVITTCVTLGLATEIENRDLEAIREFYRTFRKKGLEGTESFSKLVFELAGVKHAIMTNIPFEPTETRHWRPTPKEYSSHFRSACRIDPFLAGNQKVVEATLAASGYDVTLEGARQFLRDWCDTMKPEYVMASTPHDFVLPEDRGSSEPRGEKTGVNEEAMREPFAFATLAASSRNDAECNEGGAVDELPSVIDEDSDFLVDVLMRVCEERDLPIALKIGAHREVNPSLLQAGDGVVAFADAGVLARLCTRFPKVRFLATFLSRTNQHEACVLATKFRNLHLYGCWWFCNNPSIIREMTAMRIEMLGTAFTAQHSDSRVLDQLLYKWPHSRAVIAAVLASEYQKCVDSGWSMTREELRRDIRRLFGSSYEEFMAKSLV